VRIAPFSIARKDMPISEQSKAACCAATGINDSQDFALPFPKSFRAQMGKTGLFSGAWCQPCPRANPLGRIMHFSRRIAMLCGISHVIKVFAALPEEKLLLSMNSFVRDIYKARYE
jgi:hypothetical protein